jgi:serine/threonine-protein kinase
VEALASLRHPGLVRIFTVGEHLGRPFCAMEFVEGGSLDRRLAEGPLPVEESARLVAALARAVHAAHAQGWVHRDLKPANVLLTTSGEPKVADFGLAKHREDVLRHTRYGAVIGTPCYMAPEQAHADGREVGPRADVYALSAILYECLTGRPPFQGPSVPAILEQVRTQPPVPPCRLQPDVPEALQEICLACLAKDEGVRPSGADVLAENLERFLQRARPVEPVVPVPASAPPPCRKPGRFGRRAASAFLLLGALILALAVGSRTMRRTGRDHPRGERAIPPVPVAAPGSPVPPEPAAVTGRKRRTPETAGHSEVRLQQTGTGTVQASVSVEGAAATATVTVIDSQVEARSGSR